MLVVASACSQAPPPAPARSVEPRSVGDGPATPAVQLAAEVYPRLARAANALDDREVWDRSSEARTDFGEARNRCSSSLPSLHASPASENANDSRQRHLVVAACQKLDEARAEPGDVEQVLALLDLALLPPGAPLPRAVPRGPK